QPVKTTAGKGCPTTRQTRGNDSRNSFNSLNNAPSSRTADSILMATDVRFISADDHVIEHPEVWTRRLSQPKWGGRIPHLERQADGSDCWLVDGVKHHLLGNGSAGALMADRAVAPRTWSAVPQAASTPAQRLQ